MTALSPSILVVDDDADTCRNLADILGDFGYRVETAHDGFAALDLVRSRPFDVALLDLKMPGMDGLELYREVKRLRPSTVAIIISAHANAEIAREARGAGAWQVLAKPVDLGRLMPLIDEAVGQPLVLVVDDDPDLCESLWDLLRDRGYRVGVAHEEGQAAGLLRDASYKVVLIDMKLPGGDGGTVFQTVRRLSPESRVILVTGFRNELDDLVRRVLAEGADAICYKPFDVPELLDTVHRLTDEPQK
ncbi:MAG TPA: response regulator [Planctomycetaceae bacterium]